MNIIRLLKKTNLQPKLGRWGVTHEEKVLDKRINWANHDHCGSEVCGNLLEKETKEEKKKKQKVKKKMRGDEQDMEYYLPYCL